MGLPLSCLSRSLASRKKSNVNSVEISLTAGGTRATSMEGRNIFLPAKNDFPYASAVRSYSPVSVISARTTLPGSTPGPLT